LGENFSKFSPKGYSKQNLMKKIITMCVIVVLIAGFATIDLVFTTRFYSNTLDNLQVAALSIADNQKNLTNADTIAKIYKANDEWEKGKNRLTMLVNHNVVRQMDEKFVSLIAQIETNNYLDAMITVKALISQVKDLREENYPLLRNIL